MMTRKSALPSAGAPLDSDEMSKRNPEVESRYSFRGAVREIQRLIERLGRGAQKAVALGIGINEQQMSAKLRGVTDEMTLEQIGKVASLLDAPVGWPWVPWAEADLLPALPRLRRKLGL